MPVFFKVKQEKQRDLPLRDFHEARSVDRVRVADLDPA